MTFDAKRLYELLPAEHRIRDEKQGYPLRELVGIIAAQVAVTEDNLEQLYENTFAETASPWALPYLGDLLGIRGLSGAGTLTRAPRAEVGHTIAYRRRKGTAAMLELLARDVSGWPARAVEFFERLATTQHVNHIRRANQAFLSLRPADALEDFGTAFEQGTRTVEARRIEPAHGQWNIPNVGLFVWRLRAYSLTRSPLVQAGPPDGRHFTCDPLGLNMPLFTRPESEDEVTHLAEPLNVPMPISRRRLKGDTYEGNALANQFHPSEAYYGSGRSLVLAREIGATVTDIRPDQLLIADLSDAVDNGGAAIWAHEAFGLSEDRVLIDPMLGRVVFPQVPAGRVFVTCHYGFSMNIGGGEYNRSRSRAVRAAAKPAVAVVRVSNTASADYTTIKAALESLGPSGGVVEIMDSSRYVEVGLPVIDATKPAAGEPPRHIEVRAADQRRATVSIAAPLAITGDADGVVTLDGLLINGDTMKVGGALGRLRLRHCTIVPKLTVDGAGKASVDGAVAAMTIASKNTVVEIEDCIVAPIGVGPDVTVRVTNSVVDAGATTNVALANATRDGPSGRWYIRNTTIRGKVSVTIMELASNSIFLGMRDAADDAAIWPSALVVTRRQEGCVRFCWLPKGARVPRRHSCLPAEGSPVIRPEFTSFALNDPAYAQLGPMCPDPILRGADDESELGAFHDLHQPQRMAHLRLRLAEYLRFGLDAGVFTAT